MNTATMTIEGMHCEGCARRIEGLFEKEPGVRSAAVNFAEGSARLRYNPHTVSEERLVAVIEAGGFSVAARES